MNVHREAVINDIPYHLRKRVYCGATPEEILSKTRKAQLNAVQSQKLRAYFETDPAHPADFKISLRMPPPFEHLRIIAKDLELFTGYSALDFELLKVLAKGFEEEMVTRSGRVVPEWLAGKGWKVYWDSTLRAVLQREQERERSAVQPMVSRASGEHRSDGRKVGFETGTAVREDADMLAPWHLLQQARQLGFGPSQTTSVASVMAEAQKRLARQKDRIQSLTKEIERKDRSVWWT